MNRLRYHLPILDYHRVGAFKDDHVPTVSGQAFERQMRLLARHRIRVLCFDELMDCLEAGQPMPRRSTIITFDDGYEETYTVAWPILQRFGFPATVFVTPSEVGRPGFATWDQIVEMSNDAVTIGSHTMHHSYLPLVGRENLEEELGGSKVLIEQRVGKPVLFLCYPVGGFTTDVQTIAQRAGYRAACTTNRSLSPQGLLDRYALRRIKVTERDANPLLFRIKLSGYYDVFRRLRAPC